MTNVLVPTAGLVSFEASVRADVSFRTLGGHTPREDGTPMDIGADVKVDNYTVSPVLTPANPEDTEVTTAHRALSIAATTAKNEADKSVDELGAAIDRSVRIRGLQGLFVGTVATASVFKVVDLTSSPHDHLEGVQGLIAAGSLVGVLCGIAGVGAVTLMRHGSNRIRHSISKVQTKTIGRVKFETAAQGTPVEPQE